MMLIGRSSRLSLANNFDLLQILSELQKLKNNSRSRKRFGLLLKLIPRSRGHERISHVFVQDLFTFNNVNLINWLNKSSLMNLHIEPFLEECIISSPPELISGYSLPLLQSGIKNDIFKKRLCSAAIDYGTLFPLNQILHSICYLHWDRANNLESVITLANLITDIESVILLEDERFSIGNLVKWLHELGIRHDFILENLEQYMLSDCSFDPITNNEYLKRLLIEKGEVMMPGDAFVSFRQRPVDNSKISFKKIGHTYYWFKGRYRHSLLPIGMDKISSVDLCKIVVFGVFSDNLLNAIVNDYGFAYYTRSYADVDGDLFGQFILELARRVKIPPRNANYFIDFALDKFKTASIKGREAMIEASFHMGLPVWDRWIIYGNDDDMSIKSRALLSIMIGSKYPDLSIVQFGLDSLTSLSFIGVTESGSWDYKKKLGFRNVKTPKYIDKTPVYDRSTLMNYKWNKSRSVKLSNEKGTFDDKSSNVPFNLDNSPLSLKTAHLVLLALVYHFICGSVSIPLEYVSRLSNIRRYLTGRFSNIDSSYTLWTSDQGDYSSRIGNRMDRTIGSDIRYGIFHSKVIDFDGKNKIESNYRTRSNIILDRVTPIQSRLEYYDEYMQRHVREGALLYEANVYDDDNRSSFEDNVYQTIKTINYMDKFVVKRQVCATVFTIDFVLVILD